MQLPSPLQKVNWKLAVDFGVDIWIKRDDLIHPVVSGNKWRKLLFNVKEVKDRRLKGILTFGGAFSNHIAATAHAGKLSAIPTVGIIRGAEADLNNPTLRVAIRDGMQIIPVTREEYKTKETDEFLEELSLHFPGYLIVPEGGANLNGVLGCMEILGEIEQFFDTIACALGTSTTYAGLVASANIANVLGFPALKGGGYLRASVENFLQQLEQSVIAGSNFKPANNWQLVTDYHFGGFGKVNEELVYFMNAFYDETGIPLDPVYTGKLFFGIQQLIKNGRIAKGTRLLTVHTGGLQGVFGMNYRLRNKTYKINYEEYIQSIIGNHLPNG